MGRMIAQLSLVVREYDEAIDFYVSKLGFTLIEDTPLSDTKRWVVVAPEADTTRCKLLLAKATDDEQQSRIGNQTGGRVFLFLHTDNITRDHENLVANGVRIVRDPAPMPYGTVLVFADLYGNLWDMIQPV
jgi:catechol 2,3-dioxygenase-like lactoylglutathione lyase family enzyme